MGRRFTRLEGPGAATAVAPRHSRWIGAVDPSTLSVLRPATQPAASREVVLPGRRPEFPPRAGDTLELPNDEFMKCGGMS